LTEAARQALGVYIHWPYCARVCPYCDFNVVRDRRRTGEQAALVETILADLAANAALTGPRRLVSVFFGGGTPSLMPPDSVARIIEAARSLWSPELDVEITLEANPTDAETGRFEAFAAAGVNRLSLGVQSLDNDELKLLGRNHDAASARRAIGVAAAVFPRLSFDLIYALPGQSVSAWAQALRAVAELGPEHISPYQLTIEPGTAFHRAVGRGTLAPPGPDLGADHYEATQAVLEAAGYEAYEVSNHARGAAAKSRHNLLYWQGEDYVGVGPGAHGRVTIGDVRHATATARAVGDYVNRVSSGANSGAFEALSPRERSIERLLMGLRTAEGVELADLAGLPQYRDRLEDLGDLAAITADRLVITRRGRPVLDRIVATLVDGR
jgi:putative oxygen-independent coproporphyrinogen III oxidase